MNKEAIVKQTKELLSDILKEFLLHPEHLAVRVQALTGSAAIKLDSHPADVRRIIGPQGNHFRSLKYLVGRIGQRHSYEMVLFPIKEPGAAPIDRYDAFQKNPDWSAERVRQMFLRACQLSFRHPEAVRVLIVDDTEEGLIMEAMVATAELTRVVDGMRSCLQILFNAVGQANGRAVMVDIVAGHREEAAKK